MVDLTSNDNHSVVWQMDRPDSHGEAAMLLVESLLHDLIDRQVIDVCGAVEIVGTAAEIATELGDAPPGLKTSLAILDSLHASLSNDLPEGDLRL